MTQQKLTAVDCPQCELSDVCRHHGEDVASATLGEQTPKNSLPKGEFVCIEGEPFENLYAIHQGAFKSVVSLSSDENRVTGFYFAGEIIGSEAVCANEYGRSVVALQDSEVCIIEKSAFSIDGDDQQVIRQGLLVAMSHQVRNEQWTGLMAAHRAESRVALFLFMVSKRLEFHGFPTNEFRLPMSREDIASYLGLAVETVSRSFQKLKNAGLIQVSGRNVTLVSRSALQEFE
ncbi:MAG: helix-turn-helix domain-containing protein [Gammaproteobacteria bacterium]|jgi:CRP/FNR family transcriptional regulator|nr:helix-turn-helix domain-containing protein [Gammaproteobacteria bacterium]MBT3490239.1 helix-turn-helix domain-containing protein [Gammaproteobacteria bacterium]MBT3719832.1 helix-turn-helix domain-containing protein [Gammaproteobacteria bacterium]MBT3845680.1 helix-turn-helix domain-containing protein [Gammaproteobacteria bacterium]MBT3893119.1 helix-turn-helix domain-containing protein [Gammaproteobacteria bacterium]